MDFAVGTGCDCSSSIIPLEVSVGRGVAIFVLRFSFFWGSVPSFRANDLLFLVGGAASVRGGTEAGAMGRA